MFKLIKRSTTTSRAYSMITIYTGVRFTRLAATQGAYHVIHLIKSTPPPSERMTSQPYGGYGNSVLQQRAPAGVVHYTLQAPICLTVSVTRALCLCLSVSVSLPVRLSFSPYCRPRLRIWFLSRTMLRSCDAQSHQSQPEMWQRMQLLESEIIIFSDSSKSLQVIATAE